MQDTPPTGKGMNWKLFFLSGVLLLFPTWYVFHFISPIGNMPVLASDPAGHGAEVDRLILFVHVLMGALFVGWIGYFIYVLFRYHKSRNPKADYTGVTSHASTYLEGVVALIEGVLLIGFAIPIWAMPLTSFPRTRIPLSSKSSPNSSNGTAGIRTPTASLPPRTGSSCRATTRLDWTRT